MNVNGGNGNIALGWKAGENIVSASDQICIGHPGYKSFSGGIFIGNGALHTFCQIGCNEFSVPAVYNSPTGIGRDVSVDATGVFTSEGSSRRYKKDIADMDAASEAILSLRPVTFRYKPEFDKKGLPQFGLIAEEVEKICPDLVGRDAKGQIDYVSYKAVNAMLLNEFLKEHKRVQQQAGKIEEQDRKLQEQQATIAQLKKGMEVLTVSLKEQGAQIQKVSDQLELNKPAPQMVDNRQ